MEREREEHNGERKIQQNNLAHMSDKTDGVALGDSGEEGGRDQTVKGYMCMRKNLS